MMGGLHGLTSMASMAGPQGVPSSAPQPSMGLSAIEGIGSAIGSMFSWSFNTQDAGRCELRLCRGYSNHRTGRAPLPSPRLRRNPATASNPASIKLAWPPMCIRRN